MRTKTFITLTRQLFEEDWRQRPPQFDNVFLVIEEGSAYVEGTYGRKKITVKESPSGANAIRLGLRGKYTLLVGSLYIGKRGIEALETFIEDEKRNDVLENLLEMIVFKIAATAKIGVRKT